MSTFTDDSIAVDPSIPNTAVESRQCGFAFETPSPRLSLEAPPGTWLDPSSTCTAYRAYLTHAGEQLEQRCPKAIINGYRAGIARALTELHAVQERRKRADDAPYTLRELNLPATRDFMQRFALWCMTESPDSIEVKVRADTRSAYWAAHIDSLGTLLVRTWTAGVEALHYFAGRSSVLNASYKDQVPHRALPESIWRELYVGHRIAEALHVPARVPVFEHEGRVYVNVAIESRGDYRECEGWQVTAGADWPDATFNYATLRKAWDEGRIQRGNMRGLLIMARQRPCILDQCVIFFETGAPQEAVSAGADDAGQQLAVDFDRRRRKGRAP